MRVEPGRDNASASEAQERHSRYANIPAELKEKPQWLVWRLEFRPPMVKHTKVPYMPWQNGGKASVTDETTWGTFEQAIAAPMTCLEAVDPVTPGSRTGFTGIGFCFTVNDPYCFIDLDDTKGDIEGIQRQVKIREDFNSYTELSPSGTGIHIIIKAKLPHGRRRGGVELYPHERFGTFTGYVINNVGIADRQELAEILFNELGGAKAATAGIQPDREASQSDADIVGRLYRDSARAAVAEGDLSAYGGDHSSAEQAVVNWLALLSGNRAQVERIWLTLPLGQREKTQGRADYRERTLEAAFNQPELPWVNLDSLTVKGEPLWWNVPPSAQKTTEPTVVDAGDWQGQPLYPRKYVLPGLIPAGLVTVLGPVDIVLEPQLCGGEA